ncbi:MAG TPA: ADP-glyceromanno-heptose 6-epimerase [Gammaproteobacteria bacterium]|nr:ADP-glyceromanno-heptose 6-epimerase [Gammaproteobacteria bacterium]
MIIVTGGAGFIGSNLVHGLNQKGREDILVVDDLTDGTKFRNIVDARIMDYWDRDTLADAIVNDVAFPEKTDAVFHLGACSVTTEWDGRYMMQNNYDYSKNLFHYCGEKSIPFIYASSGSVYGINENFREIPANEKPVNVYGYSKFLFDNYVRMNSAGMKSQVAGLRYFNVYGPREQHKKAMASVAWHFNQQLLSSGHVKLFRGDGPCADGEQRRDFIHVDDIIRVNLWFMDHPDVSGIFNVGTGKSRTFNDFARAVINWHGQGEIEYIDFPEHLRGSYQSFTQADLAALKGAGYSDEFISLEAGVRQYLDWLNRGQN